MAKVCPSCGSEFFERYQVRKERALVTLDEQNPLLISSTTTEVLPSDGKLSCHQCASTFDSENDLVTEEQFHDMIAPGVGA